MHELLHIALPGDLSRADAAGSYRAASLERDGFLHCCDRAQLAGVLARWFSTGQALVLLRIDADRLAAPAVLENTVGGSELFAHVYGALPLEAIVARLPFIAPELPPLDG